MTDLIKTLSELSTGSDEITSALKNLRNQSTLMKTNYAEILTKTNQLHTAMLELTDLSEHNQTPPAIMAAAQ